MKKKKIGVSLNIKKLFNPFTVIFIIQQSVIRELVHIWDKIQKQKYPVPAFHANAHRHVMRANGHNVSNFGNEAVNYDDLYLL